MEKVRLACGCGDCHVHVPGYCRVLTRDRSGGHSLEPQVRGGGVAVPDLIVTNGSFCEYMGHECLKMQRGSRRPCTAKP